MTKSLAQKNIRLSLEFDRYVSKNPRVLDRIPNRSEIIMTSANDRELSEANLGIARRARSGRFVIAHKSDGRWTIKRVAKIS